MFKFLIVLFCLFATAFGFTASSQRRTSLALNAKSKALPFIDAPKKLDGSAVGDFGFDPLGFTDTLSDLYYVKEAELKHGRVAMLATVGFVFTQFIRFRPDGDANPLTSISTLGLGVNLQVLFAIGCVELATWDKTFSGKGVPGDFNFDPMGQLKGKSPAQINTLKLKELKNGRLAMIAIMGMLAETLIFGQLAIFK